MTFQEVSEWLSYMTTQTGFCFQSKQKKYMTGTFLPTRKRLWIRRICDVDLGLNIGVEAVASWRQNNGPIRVGQVVWEQQPCLLLNEPSLYSLCPWTNEGFTLYCWDSFVKVWCLSPLFPSICPPLVVMEVIDSKQVACKLFKGMSDALICTDDFITKVVQRWVVLHRGKTCWCLLFTQMMHLSGWYLFENVQCYFLDDSVF